VLGPIAAGSCNLFVLTLPVDEARLRSRAASTAEWRRSLRHPDGHPRRSKLDPACHLGDGGRVPLTGRGYPTGLHVTFSEALRRLPVAATVGMVLADGDHEGGGGLIALLIILLVLYLLFRK
jgi:hypothetical protein